MSAIGELRADLRAVEAWMRSSRTLDLGHSVANVWPWEPGASNEQLESLVAMYPGLPGDVLAMFGVSRRFFAGDLTYELRKGEPSSWFMGAIESGITQGCSYAHRARRKDVFELDGLAVQIGLGVEHRYLVLELYGESHGRIAVSRSLTHEQFWMRLGSSMWTWMG